MSLLYDNVYAWTKKYDLIINRINVINQLLGFRGAFRVGRESGSYQVRCFGTDYASFRTFDLVTTESVLDMLDSVVSFVWLSQVSGYQLTATKNHCASVDILVNIN